MNHRKKEIIIPKSLLSNIPFAAIIGIVAFVIVHACGNDWSLRPEPKARSGDIISLEDTTIIEQYDYTCPFKKYHNFEPSHGVTYKSYVEFKTIKAIYSSFDGHLAGLSISTIIALCVIYFFKYFRIKISSQNQQNRNEG